MDTTIKKVGKVLMMALTIGSIGIAKAQNDFPDSLPSAIILDRSIIRSYQMTTDYYNYDLKSNFLFKERLTGVITYGLNGDSVQWKDVYYAKSNMLDAAYPQGEKKNFMQNFKYKPDERILSGDFFATYSPEADVQTMNLIWDALCFDALAYCCWDSLKLNKEFQAINMNSEAELAGIGTFENKDIRITWLGITKMNGKLCAIIKYSVLNNPLKMELENMSMSGRSHYWGEIFVSLSDKQIEHANLTEDVLTDVKLKGQENNHLGYVLRTINFIKLNK